MSDANDPVTDVSNNLRWYPRLQGHKLPPTTASSGCHHSSRQRLLVVKTPLQTHPTAFPYMSLRPHMVLQHCDIHPGGPQITQ